MQRAAPGQGTHRGTIASGLAHPVATAFTALLKPGVMFVAQIAIAVLLSSKSSSAAELAEPNDTELADPTLTEDLALQTEMLNYFCERNGDSAICHMLEHERELHGGEEGHWQLPVQHLQKEEDDEVHSVWCAAGAPGATGNPKLCDEYEKRAATRIRDRVLKEQVRITTLTHILVCAECGPSNHRPLLRKIKWQRGGARNPQTTRITQCLIAPNCCLASSIAS